MDMEAEVGSESVESRSNPLETTVVLEGEEVRIRVDPEALKRDLARESREQGVPEERLTAVVEATTFTVFSGTEGVADHLSDPEHKAIAVGFRRWLSGKSRRPATEIAAIVPKAEGKFEFLFNVGGLMEFIAKNGVPNFRMAPNAPKETKRMFVSQALDSVWRHERQHLIQFMDPEKGEKILERLKIAGIVHSVTVSALMGSLPLTLISTSALIPERMRLPLFLTSAVAMAVTRVAANLYLTKFQHWSPHEREAKRYQKPDHWRGSSPFQVTFEGS